MTIPPITNQSRSSSTWSEPAKATRGALVWMSRRAILGIIVLLLSASISAAPLPTSQPSAQPSNFPSVQPSAKPTMQPSSSPTSYPTNQPSAQPTRQPTAIPSAQPSAQPILRPTSQPSRQPSSPPSGQPTRQPSGQPSRQPSASPSMQPSAKPTSVPTRQPSSAPSAQPSRQPSAQPSEQPHAAPSGRPTTQPSGQPSRQPSGQPSGHPTSQPSMLPTEQPSRQPSAQPTGQPVSWPSTRPTAQPSCVPSAQPSRQPTTQPSRQPTRAPSRQPSAQPTGQPSAQPVVIPSSCPSGQPTRQPSAQPSRQPTGQPSAQPSACPTGQPSRQPSSRPSGQPTSAPSAQPTRQPTSQPSAQPVLVPSSRPTGQPSLQPSGQPTVQPSGQPSAQPQGVPTGQPTRQPTSQPSAQPVVIPTSHPTSQPSGHPTRQPSTQPSGQPTLQPAATPTGQPSRQPTSQPSAQPVIHPTSIPTGQPSRQPSSQPSVSPSAQPTQQPQAVPTGQPSRQPTSQPSAQPVLVPTSRPTGQPSTQPSGQPVAAPSGQPTQQPVSAPTGQPSRQPTSQPSAQPVVIPTSHPTGQPSGVPTRQPSTQPTGQPSGQPVSMPTAQPSRQPTSQPSAQPVVIPTSHPTMQPSGQPSAQPVLVPTGQPTAQPNAYPTAQPSRQPTGQPSSQPVVIPTSHPTAQPSGHPTRQPSTQPSSQPSAQPASYPTGQPTRQPTSQPSAQPVVIPTSHPTSQPSGHPTRQPSTQPSGQPTLQPAAIPTGQPSRQPTSQPSAQPVVIPTSHPTMQPSGSPTSQPSRQPTGQPSAQPVLCPTGQPSRQPTSQPSAQPIVTPTSRPTSQPSRQPSTQPTAQPSSQPTSQPSGQPSGQPSLQPVSFPTMQPSVQPTSCPSVQPTSMPSCQPSMQPTTQPSAQPVLCPTGQPSQQPSAQPSTQPSYQPSSQPSAQPAATPTSQPSTQPSRQPTSHPTSQPTGQPSLQPFAAPTGQPSGQPTSQPSAQPFSSPTSQPTMQPSVVPSQQPSAQPSSQPTGQPVPCPTSQPSTQPTAAPSMQPTVQPTSSPTQQPSSVPTMQPSTQPSSLPSTQPTSQPSGSPTGQPTAVPSCQPSSQPSSSPTAQPSIRPTTQPSTQPSGSPTTQPSAQPSSSPTRQPSGQPSRQPSTQPTTQPSEQPLAAPTSQPSGQPSGTPTMQPSCQPTSTPSMQPTSYPSSQPSCQPTGLPTCQPTQQPSGVPSAQPSSLPSSQPSEQPTTQPSTQPTSQPSTQPTVQPSGQPSVQPTSKPSQQPSMQPTSHPSVQPSAQPSSQPSVQPSARPSCQPSAQPSSYPTPIPSQYHNLTEWQVRLWQEVRNATLSVDSGVHQLLYSELLFDYEFNSGGCSAWQKYLRSVEMKNALNILQVQSVSVSTIKLMYDYYETIDQTPEARVCAHQPTAANIVQRLAYSDTLTADYDVVCNGTQWRIKNCVVGSPSVCINCADPCTVHCSNARYVHFVTSCVQEGAYCEDTLGRRNGLKFDINLMSVTAIERNTAPNIVSISTAPTRTGAAVTVELDRAGGAQCAAVLTTAAAPTTLDQIRLAGALSYGNGSLVLSTTGLVPCTNYALYCFTFAASGATMPYKTMLQQGVASFTTQCYKQVTIRLATSTVYISEQYASFLQMEVEAAPSQDLTISFELSPAPAATALFPSAYTLTAQSARSALQKTLGLQASALSAGTYTVVVTLTGSSHGEYESVFADDVDTFTLLAASSEPSTPTIVSATYSNSGDLITVLFDSETDRGGVALGTRFTCSAVLAFTGAGSHTCTWRDDRTLVIYTSSTVDMSFLVGVDAYVAAATAASGASIDVGDLIAARSSTIRVKCRTTPAICTSYAYVSSTATVDAPAIEVVQPKWVISAPRTVNKCDGIPLDLTGSSNFAGGPFLNFSLTVTSSTASQAVLDDIQAYIQGTYTLLPPATLPAALFAKAAEYTFLVRGCSVLGRCSSAAHTVYVSNTTAPFVMIEGSLLRTVYPHEVLVLRADAYMYRTCDGVASKRNLTYTWFVRRDGITIPALQSVSNNPATFKLPAYSLDFGTVYYVYLSVQDIESGYSAQNYAVVYVESANIVAVLSGGATRVVRVDEWFTISARSSYDENSGLTGVEVPFVYAWSCSLLAPTLSDTCDTSDFTITDDGTGVLYVLPLSPNITAIFTVMVTLTDADGTNRTSTASTTITTVASVYLNASVSVAPYSPSTVLYAGDGGVIVVNPAQKVKLAGTITLGAGSHWSTDLSLYGRWQVNDTTISTTADVDGALDTPSELALASYMSSTPLTGVLQVPFNLVVQGGALTSGATYLFTLSVAGFAASAVVTVNAPPAPGSLSVSPASGTELSTVFTLVTSTWQDNDLPLQYQFGYLSSTDTYVPLSEPSEVGSVVTTLPALRRSAASGVDASLTAIVFVSDCFGANNSLTISVTVEPAGRTRSAVLDSLRADLDSAAEDPRNLRKLVAVYTAAINSVECSLAPDCAALNRQDCVNVVNTCGSCLVGFTGIEGSSNSACISYNQTTEDANRRRLSLTSEDERCHSAEDCSNPFATCVQHSCHIPAKSCPTAVDGEVCSGNGECVFVNTDSYEVVSACLVSDLFCEARCVCTPTGSIGAYTPGYAGDACEISPNGYAASVQTRLLLVQALSNLTAYDDFSSETVLSWSNMVLSLAGRSSELSNQAIVEIAGLMQQVLYASSVVAVPLEIYRSLMTAQAAILDALAQAADFEGYAAGLQAEQTSTASSLSFSLSLLRQLEAVLDAYTSTIAEDLVLGQNAAQTRSQSLVSTVQVLPVVRDDVGSTDFFASGYDIVLPLSPMEQLLLPQPTTLIIPAVQSALASEGVVVSAFALKSRLFTSALLVNQSASYENTQGHLVYRSRPLRLRIASLSGSALTLNCSAYSNNSTVNPCESTVVLQYNQYAPFIEPWENVTYTTCYDQDYYVARYPCLTRPGTNLTIPCPKEAGLIVDRCPIYNVTTVCNTLVNQSAQSLFAFPMDTVVFNYSSCDVQEFTAYNVTCRCRFDVDGVTLPAGEDDGRRLTSSTSSDGTAVEFTYLSAAYVAQARLYVIPFNQTYTRSPYYRSPYTSRIVFWSMGSLAAVVLILSVASFGNDILIVPKKGYKAGKSDDGATLQNGTGTGGAGASKGAVKTLVVAGREREIAVLVDDTRSGAAGQRRLGSLPGVGAATQWSVTLETVTSTLPVFFQDLNQEILAKAWREMRVYHRWLSILTHYARGYSRAYRIVALLYQVVTPLFLTALIFAYLNPDDGRCAKIKNQRDCIADKSEYVSGYAKCIWYTSNQSCDFRQPQQSMQTILLVVFTAALVSVPIARAVEMVLVKICIPAAPPQVQQAGERVKPSHRSSRTAGGRWWNFFSRRAEHRSNYPEHASDDGSGDGIYRYAENEAAAVADAADLTIDMNSAAPPRGMTLSATDRLAVRNALTAQVYAQYPVTLFVRRTLGLAVPVRFLPVDFIDGVGVKQELDLLQSRVQNYSDHLLREGMAAERQRLLAMWGMDDQGNFLRSTVYLPEDPRWYQVEDRCDVLIQRDLQTCRDLTKEELYMLDAPPEELHSSPAEKTARMLYLLQRDLLGSPIASMIVEKKSIRECFYCDKESFPAYNSQLGGARMTIPIKIALWGMLLLWLIVMVGCILYYALVYPSQLQRAWLYALYAFLGFDCVVISTFEVVITHIWIPSLILPDARVVRDVVAATLQRYQINTAAAEESKNNMVREFTGRAVNTRMIRSAQNQLAEDDQEVPNISEFFFVSARLAAYFSELPESKLVQTYATMLPPGALFAQSSWWRPLSKALQDTDVAAHRANSGDTAAAAQSTVPGHGPDLRQRPYRSAFGVLAVPSLFADAFRSYIFCSVQTQDVLLQMLSVVVFGVVGVISLALYQMLPYLVVAPVALALGVYVLCKVGSAVLRCVRYVNGRVRARRERLLLAAAAAASSAGATTTGAAGAARGSDEHTKTGRPTSPSDRLTSVVVATAAPKPVNPRILEAQRQTLINASALRRTRVAPAPSPTASPSRTADGRVFFKPRRIDSSGYDSKSDSGSSGEGDDGSESSGSGDDEADRAGRSGGVGTVLFDISEQDELAAEAGEKSHL